MAQRLSSSTPSGVSSQNHRCSDRVESENTDCDDENCHQHHASCSSGGSSPSTYSTAPSGSDLGSIAAGQAISSTSASAQRRGTSVNVAGSPVFLSGCHSR